MINIECRQADKVADKFSLYVSFSFNQFFIDEIKELPERAWHKDTKEWEVPVNQLENLLHLFEKQDVKISGQYVDMTPVTDIDYQFKTEPYEHQKVGFLYGLNHTKWFLGDEQGLGKTKQVIDIACALKEKKHYTHCLIICGVNSLKWNWQREVETHSSEHAYILGQRVKKRTKEVYIGLNKDKLADLENLDEILDYFIITNVESLRSSDITDKLVSLIKEHKLEFIAVDEIHKCLGYDTPIFTDNGYIRLGDIVTYKLPVSVYSYNETTQQVELKPVIDWHENLITEPLLRLKFMTERGIKEIRCTKDHKFLTSNRGWVEAQYLSDTDDIVEY